MTSFTGRLAEQVRDERCPDCGGAVVPARVWLDMPEAALAQWEARLVAEQGRAERLQPGDEVPAPVLCLCEGNGPRAGLRLLRGEA